MPKYKLLPTSKSVSSNAPQMYIIVAQEDFYTIDDVFIPCGTEGGFVESYENMPNTHEDKSWIFATDGFVVGEARIKNSSIHHGYVSGNAVVEGSIVTKKSSIMENANVKDSIIEDSIIGVNSRVWNCEIKDQCCINLYENMYVMDSTITDSSISGNIIILDGKITNCALHNGDTKKVGYNCVSLKDKTEIEQISLPYREKHGGSVYLKNNKKFAKELNAAKAEGELRSDSEAATGVPLPKPPRYTKKQRT